VNLYNGDLELVSSQDIAFSAGDQEAVDITQETSGNGDLVRVVFKVTNARQVAPAFDQLTASSGATLLSAERVWAYFPANTFKTRPHFMLTPPVALAKALPPQSASSRGAIASFRVTADDGDAAIEMTSQPYLLAFNYTNAQLEALGVTESTMTLVARSGDAWVQADQCVGCRLTIDRAHHRLIASVNYLGEFALAPKTKYVVHLPQVAK